MTITGPGARSAAPGQAVVDAAMLVLERMGLTPADLLAAPAATPAYAGHEDNGRGARAMGAMATYVRAGLPEVATALAALTGEPHPLAIKDPGTGPAGEYRH